MEDNKTSIFERLKICWHVLTKKYYLYVGLDKDSIIWDKDGKYLSLKESSVKAFVYISKDYQFLAYGKKTNLHDFVLKVIVKFINEKLLTRSSGGTFFDKIKAEKFNELTWMDLKMIDEISDEVYAEYDVDKFDEKEYYQEVLNRFLIIKVL